MTFCENNTSEQLFRKCIRYGICYVENITKTLLSLTEDFLNCLKE